MGAGRPRKNIDNCTGHKSKAEIEERQEQESKLKLDSNNIKCPTWLSKEAKKEFRRVRTELQKVDLLANVDTSILAIYSDAYANYIILTKSIELNGAVQTYTNTKGETNKVVSADVQAQQKYIDTIMKCSSKLGLSISDRLKLIVPTQDEKPINKFSQFA